MLTTVPASQWLQRIFSDGYGGLDIGTTTSLRSPTCMHRPQHARDELVYSIALLNEGNQCGDTAFIVSSASEMRKYQLLEAVNLILQCHQVRDGLIARPRQFKEQTS